MLWHYWQEKQLNKTQIFFIFVVFALIVMPLNISMTNLWSIPHNGLGLLFRGALICMVQSIILGALLGRFTVSRVIQIVRTISIQIWVAILTGFGLAAFLNGDAVLITGTVSGVIIGLVTKEVRKNLLKMDNPAPGFIAVDAIGLIIAVGLVLGILIRVTAIRLWASLRHLPEGLMYFSQNWHESVLGIDVMQAPTLLPDSEKVASDLSFRLLLNSQSSDLLEKCTKSLYLIAIYLPAMVYRLNIKASALLWGVVVFALRPAHWADDETMREKMAIQTTWPLLGLMLTFALGVLVFLLGHWIPEWVVNEAPDWIKKLAPHLSEPALNLRTTLLTFFAINWSLLLWFSYCLRSAHDNPLGGAGDYDNYKEDKKTRFRYLAKRVQKSSQWTAAFAFLTIWSYGLAWALQKWPETLQHVVWNWFKPWL
jgi:hypothetical protein